MVNNKWAKRVLFTSIIFAALVVATEISNQDLKPALITLAQINVAISVGVGALSINYVKKSEDKSRLTEITIAIAGLSLLTFLIAHIEHPIINRVYLVMNILIITITLVMTLIDTENKKQKQNGRRIAKN